MLALTIFRYRRVPLGALLLLAAALVLCCARAWSQDKYPVHPIRIVVGFAPGGPTDVQARLLASKLGPILDQTVVVENKPGASTTIALADVARAAPDGYTLYFGGSGAYATTPLTMSKLPYDPVASFEPIALVGEEQIAFAVHPSLPAKDMKELVALIKANPGKYSFGSSGHGNITHLTGELFKLRAGGLDLPHVAYKGAAPAVNDVLAGHIEMIVGGLGSVYPMHREGKVRVLAITSEKRASYAKDVPTAWEAGLDNVISSSTLVLLAPARTPQSVIATLSKAVSQAVSQEAYQKEMRGAYVEPITDSTPQATGELLARELEQWKELVQTSGIKVAN